MGGLPHWGSAPDSRIREVQFSNVYELKKVKAKNFTKGR